MTSEPRSARFEAVFLLLAAGGAIGLLFPLSKRAAEIGLPPLAYSLWSSLGAAILVMVVALAARAKLKLDRPCLRYAVVAGLLTFALPFGLIPIVIAHIGSAVPAILQSLAPLITILIAYALGLERPRLVRLAGLALGFCGAIAIILGRGGAQFSLGWIMVALAVPAALAAGNVYRSTGWPRGADALALAAVTFFGAFAWIAIATAVLTLAGQPVPVLAAVRQSFVLLAGQAICLAVGYAFFFRLQQVAGPVFLSQISYVNTGVGLAFAVAWFGEPVSRWTWAAAALVLAGIAIVNATQARPSRVP